VDEEEGATGLGDVHRRVHLLHPHWETKMAERPGLTPHTGTLHRPKHRLCTKQNKAKGFSHQGNDKD